MRIRTGALGWITVHDTYLGGRGRMSAKVLDLFPVVNAAGPELDVGELVTWLNDALLFAPSMLLDPAVAWAPNGDRQFGIALTHAGHTVMAWVRVDDRGAPRLFVTTDRFVQDPYDPRHR